MVVNSFVVVLAGAMDKGGVGALELVAMDMKARLEHLPGISFKVSNFKLKVSPILGECMFVAR